MEPGYTSSKGGGGKDRRRREGGGALDGTRVQVAKVVAGRRREVSDKRQGVWVGMEGYLPDCKLPWEDCFGLPYPS